MVTDLRSRNNVMQAWCQVFIRVFGRLGVLRDHTHAVAIMLAGLLKTWAVLPFTNQQRNQRDDYHDCRLSRW